MKFTIAKEERVSYFFPNMDAVKAVMEKFGFNYILTNEYGMALYFSYDGKIPVTCPECGEPIGVTDDEDDLQEFLNGIYHYDCGDICYDCDEWTPNSYLTNVGNSTFICDDCLSDNWEMCHECEEYYRREDMYEGDNGEWYCECCADDYYTCDNCGRLLVECDLVDEHGNHYCRECRNDGYGNWEPKAISYYHNGRDSIFISTGSTHTSPYQGNSYIGIELEFEYLDTMLAVEALPKQFKAEEDGSVRCGYELISDAMTFNYWKQAIDLDELIADINRYGGCAGTSAGIHLNISTHNMGTAQKAEIIRFVYENWDSLIKFGRRPFLEGNYYKCPPKYDDDDFLVRKCAYHCCGTNTSHRNRMELRFFNSSIDADHIWAILEFGHCIMEIVKACEALSWDSIIEYAKKDGDCEHLIAEYENNFESEERNEIIANC